MMAYPYDDSRTILALQIDHSRVAGYLAAHWGNQDFDRPQPYSSVVLAAGEHDIGWWEWEMCPSTLNDKGYPLDYHDGSLKYLGQLRLDFYKNAVDRVTQRDPYAAMLMAMHGVALMNAGYGKYAYPPDRTSDPRVKAYVDDQEAVRLKLLAQLRQSEQFKKYTSDEHVWTNYEYMEVFDQLAQFICNRYPLNSKARKLGPTNTLNDVDIPTKHGQRPAKISIDTVAESKAVLRPYPFDMDPLPVSFTARLVPTRRYKNGEDFLGEFYRAERITVTHSLASTPSQFK
ncbi:MAG TPA: DUF3891 family protein [Candidatus Binatia bacterium]